MNLDRFLTTKDVARICGMHPKTVAEMCRTGRLKAYKPGKAYLVAREDLDAWIDAHAVACSPGPLPGSPAAFEGLDGVLARLKKAGNP